MISQTRISPSMPQTAESKRTKPTMINSKEFNRNGPPMSARTFKNSSMPTNKVRPRDLSAGGIQTWSMSPLKEALPSGSPPPGCSSGSSPLSSTTGSPKSVNSFSSDMPTTEFSTPRNQVKNQFFGVTKGTDSGSEVTEGMENAKGFSRFCHTNFQNNNPKGSCLSKLEMGETTFLGPQHHEFLGPELPSEREESSVHGEYVHVACADQSTYQEASSNSGSSIVGRVMDRPKPYHEFLDEVKKQELKAEIEAWKKAEHMRLMTKLRREEAAIDDWEFRQTSKALKEIKKIESKLEKQREKAVENTWKTITMTKEEANKKKGRVRRSTIGKISAVSETCKIERSTFSSTKKWIWHKATTYGKSMYLKSVRRTPLPSGRRQLSLS